MKNVNFNTAGESFYGTPLVYTPTGFKNELVILVSDMNIIRVVDGITSDLYKSRTLDPPSRRSMRTATTMGVLELRERHVRIPGLF